jgi:hypothetical protein
VASPSAEDPYLAGLRRELIGKTGEDRDAILKEIERVGGSVPDASPRRPAKPAPTR